MSDATPHTPTRQRSRRSRRREADALRPYHALLSRVQALGFGFDEEMKLLGVTSCSPGEGVSTVAANLAIQAAKTMQCRGLLVDCNFTAPTVHKTFDVPAAPGLRDLLDNDLPEEEFIRSTTIPRLSVVTAGEIRDEADSFLPPNGLHYALASMRSSFDFVIFDLPAVSRPTNVVATAARLDGVLVVLEAERTPDQLARDKLAEFKQAGAEVLGVVLSKQRRQLPSWLGGGKTR